jgi:hypothetical protein
MPGPVQRPLRGAAIALLLIGQFATSVLVPLLHAGAGRDDGDHIEALGTAHPFHGDEACIKCRIALEGFRPALAATTVRGTDTRPPGPGRAVDAPPRGIPAASSIHIRAPPAAG